MSFREVVSSSDEAHKLLFYEVFSKTQEAADTFLHLPGREKVSLLADEFFTYLQENLELFNGADSDLNTLIERLKPYKSNQLNIEPLLQKIIKDLLVQNRKLMEISIKKVVPFSSSLAAFPLPLTDTTTECAELTTAFLRNQKFNFSLSETLEMCCLLASQNMKTQATVLFNFHTLKHFIKNPQEVTTRFIEYEQEAQWTLHPDAVRQNIFFLRNHLKDAISNSAYRDLLSRIPPALFHWIQNGGPEEEEENPGEKELFQGYEQLAKQDYARAFELFKQAADLGNSSALVKMGDCYWYGIGVPAKNYTKAFELFKQAACDLDNSLALVAMGNCYWHGKGGPAKDYDRTFQLYKQAADLGNSQALVKMGDCYWDGVGVPANDYDKAFQLYKQAADLGNSLALVAMGDCCATGKGVPVKDYDRAFQLYKKAADLGNSQALVTMGYCYWRGEGGQAQNYDRAFELYNEADELGNPLALVAMGDCYRTGNGVPAKDYDKAFQLYKQAADLDEPLAFVAMGDCYWTGNGVPQNDQRAFESWLTAKKLDNNYGALKAAKCLTWGRGTKKNLEEAKAILQILISRNVADAKTFYAENF